MSRDEAPSNCGLGSWTFALKWLDSRIPWRFMKYHAGHPDRTPPSFFFHPLQPALHMIFHIFSPWNYDSTSPIKYPSWCHKTPTSLPWTPLIFQRQWRGKGCLTKDNRSTLETSSYIWRPPGSDLEVCQGMIRIYSNGFRFVLLGGAKTRTLESSKITVGRKRWEVFLTKTFPIKRYF